MSQDLLDRLAAYGTHLRDEQVPIALSEVLGDERPAPPVHLDGDRQPRRARSRAVALLVGAAIVAAVSVGLSWLVRGTDDIAPSDSVPAVVPTIDGPETTVSIDSDVVVWETTATDTVASDVASEPTVSPTTGAAAARSVSDPSPVQLEPDLPIPESGATQPSIIGDITWTRVDGPLSGSEDVDAAQVSVEFVFDDAFYGSSQQFDGSVQTTSWWTSTDGVDWEPFENVPDQPGGVRLDAVDGAMWAETWKRWPTSGEDASLYRWDGATFVPVTQPGLGPAPGEGLVVRESTATVVAGLGGEWIIVRQEWFGVPWADLLDFAPPFEYFEANPPGTDTFDVVESQCNWDFGGGSCERAGETWQIRPEMTDTDPVRINLYDAATDELITTVVPPADLVAELGAEQVLDDLGRYNYVGLRREAFVVSADGSARPHSLPVGVESTGYDFVEFDGRLYTLGGLDGVDERRLWATSNLDTWETVELPDGIDVDTIHQVASDVDTLILRAGGSTTYWMTTDGRSWTAQTSAVEDHSGTRLVPSDFGWFETGHSWQSPWEHPPDAPVFAVSPDAVTWQLVPLPLPAALAEHGLTWADAPESVDDESIDLSLFDWFASAHADVISIDLGSERWIGRVQPP